MISMSLFGVGDDVIAYQKLIETSCPTTNIHKRVTIAGLS
jgi:hypothetical protein